MDLNHARLPIPPLRRTTRLMSGWGVKFFDYDHDGNLDLSLADGHPDDKIEKHSSQVSYQEPLLLFHNTRKGTRECEQFRLPRFCGQPNIRSISTFFDFF
jgi:enediyne biosynthesis protein E4